MLRAAAIAAVLLSACAAREAPYRFRSPMLGGVHASEPKRPRPEKRPAAEQASDLAQEFPKHRSAPINRPALEPGASPALADVLRGLVGHRDADSSHLEFAFQATAAVGAQLDPEVASLDRGSALVALARARDAIGGTVGALVGDLVVFDRVVGRRSASLVGVVVSRRRDGTVEFVYLARGIVRRGWLNNRRPAVKRRDDGRVLNTFVRHSNGGSPRGTKYLAGELFASIVKLDRLTR